MLRKRSRLRECFKIKTYFLKKKLSLKAYFLNFIISIRKLCMVMFLLSFFKGVQIRGGESISASGFGPGVQF